MAPHKVLFGSDFSKLPLDGCMTQVKALGLLPEIEYLFLFEKARRVFQLP